MDTRTLLEIIQDELKESGRPLLSREILDRVKKHRSRQSGASLRVQLHQYVARNLLGVLKIKGRPSFYTHPDWVENGQLKEGYEFDVVFRNFKQPINAKENNPVGVPNP